MGGLMNTYGRYLDFLGHNGLFADHLSRLVYDFLVGLESMLTCYLVMEVEKTKTHWTEMGLEEVDKLL